MTAIFGNTATIYLPRLDAIFRRHAETRYHFWDANEYAVAARRDPAEAQRTYWREMLERAHLGALTSMLRTKRWADGALAGFAQNNLLAAAACLRGLIEAAADSFHGLAGVPETLAHEHANVSDALAGAGDAILVSTGLEDRLIHLLYARKLDRTQRELEPESHRALHVSEYNRFLEQAGMQQALDLYSLLCQFTHPAAHSLLYAVQETETGHYFSPTRDSSVLTDILSDHAAVLSELLPFALNPAILTLAILNHFDVPHLLTPEVNAWSLNDLPMWRRYMTMMSHQPQRPGDA